MPKPSVEDLKSIGILNWSEIKAKYAYSDLYVGNGFSIKISNQLAYNSLFDKFLEELAVIDKEIFKQFGTTNFELILEKIGNAISVDEIYKVPSDPLIASLPKLKKGLVATINKNHPRHAQINAEIFDKLSFEFDSFGDVYTTNYDTFLYKIVMSTKDRYEAGQKIKRYQDYFWLTQGNYLKFMDTQSDDSYKNIYFLHGALFIFQTIEGNFKIKRGDGKTELLDIISEKIGNAEFPLFVTEGNFKDKENAINRNGYLSFCRTKFKNTNKNLVMYGASFSNQDSHFITDLNYNKRNLAISIFCENSTIPQLKAETHRILSKFNNLKDEEIVFFDSDSLF